MSEVTLQVVVSKDFLKRSGIAAADPLDKRIAALRNAVVGVSAVGGSQDRAARWLVSQGNKDAAAVLKVAMVGGPPALQAALENARVDAFLLSPPEGLIAQQRGYGTVLINLGSEFPQLRTLPFLVLVAKKPVAAKSELAIRTVRALQQASAATRKDPVQAAAKIQHEFFPKADPAVIAAAVSGMSDGIAGAGGFTGATIRQILLFAAEPQGGLDKRLDDRAGEEDLWSNQFVDAAAKSQP
jgi:ABC-type nitrate/sulfonate/bicarbonate transport system substrate-binding protein